MCHRLGIHLYTSSISEVKGRIERLFQTLQSRLAVEMRLKGIKKIEQANEFLICYIKEFNDQFSLPFNNTINAFENPLDNSKINEVLVIASRRKCDNGGYIKYHNKYYKFFNQDGH